MSLHESLHTAYLIPYSIPLAHRMATDMRHKRLQSFIKLTLVVQ